MYNNYIPSISFIRIGIGLTQQFSQEQEEKEEEPNKKMEESNKKMEEPNKKMETMTYYKIMHKLYHELKNKK
jgi:hypothetical protein